MPRRSKWKKKCVWARAEFNERIWVSLGPSTRSLSWFTIHFSQLFILVRSDTGISIPVRMYCSFEDYWLAYSAAQVYQKTVSMLSIFAFLIKTMTSMSTWNSDCGLAIKMHLLASQLNSVIVSLQVFGRWYSFSFSCFSDVENRFDFNVVPLINFLLRKLQIKKVICHDTK